ncbi:MAG: hypothetical protein UX02_C0002G0277 [Candidatus Moranbacteria bacterium GW2011_GWC1_45_18]|nr:MAG: hypothetical protein UT79_C0001G0184 [Candidatus Moranbacteria bacterium GW2011_GWC2_40_12]KKT99958.1 MAG: hypothetical protein UX02_C0002G0277 [Candidatus Moranbacteria bacterium GW2011_GWC1_45_18]OGI39280.1 MAG: hypothetical protein A2374_01045 [Candidatus Moranbacteria bacterium RIFOXYB1_FULL_44_23]OGI43364.1 MAG: hypothetical protein A2593_04185 [Candidatus Moranbacteria bacterium RIFOXYD1_FULL_44_9]HBB37073.1 hypothetical protein [Candidatus Moranbacteria bacterium]
MQIVRKTKKTEKNSLSILLGEADEFAREGTRINIANPQSMADGIFGGKYLTICGQRMLDCSRLDYLGLGSNIEIKKIMKRSIDQNDLGCPASQIVMKTESTVSLEKKVAGLHGMDNSIIFTAGYPANENIIQALGLRMNTPHLVPYVRDTKMGLLSRETPTLFYVNTESHFSIQHGVRLAKAQAPDRCYGWIYKDTEQLRNMLQKSKSKFNGSPAVRVIATDTLSSATGRIFDIQELCQIAEEYDCLLYLDEAHAMGVVGQSGCGVASALPDFGNYADRCIVMGTLTKAFSHLGGYVALSNAKLSWFLRFCSPQYIFSAPIPPWMAESLVRTIDFVCGEEGAKARRNLILLSEVLKTALEAHGFDLMGSSSHIVPVRIGNEQKADEVKKYLESRGIIASLFKHPAVPRGEALIRFSVCTDMTFEEMEEITSKLVEARETIQF